MIQTDRRKKGTGRKERSPTAPILTCPIMRKECATIATISSVDRVKLLIAITLILITIAKGCVKTVILILITMQKE